MSGLTYELRDGVATIAMDDGKVNALSVDMLKDIHGAIDQATSDDALIVLAGRDGRFSGGFDLGVITGGGGSGALMEMLRLGFEVTERLLSYPRPVVMACTGHAIAMGVFLLLSGDYRIGADGPYKITANEVAIGLTMPRAAIELCRQRLTPAAFNRAVNLSEVFTPAEAVTAGFLDRVVEPAQVREAAVEQARAFLALNANAHTNTKLMMRSDAIAALTSAIDAELRPR